MLDFPQADGWFGQMEFDFPPKFPEVGFTPFNDKNPVMRSPSVGPFTEHHRLPSLIVLLCNNVMFLYL